MNQPTPLTVRIYGTAGPGVVLLHGGPGAPGYLAPVGRTLAADFRVLEPFQRRSGDVPLTVARHVADLQQILDTHAPGERPLLVGHSWGAMLALAYAARHPDHPAGVALVGCGTFTPASRAEFERRVQQRGGERLEQQKQQILNRHTDPDRRLAALGLLMSRLYACDPLPAESETAWCDARGHEESWEDMLVQQQSGKFPAALARITCPVLLLQGNHDPHPGPHIRDDLLPYIPHLEYTELDRCGHEPWNERHARETFYATLTGWLHARATRTG